MNKILTIAALALVLSACSNEDNDIQTPVEQPAKSEGIPFTATISIGENAMTRALTEDATNNQIVPTWVAGEKVALIHNGVNDEMSVASVSGGVATITGTITGTPTTGDAVTIIYPSTAADGTTGNVKANLLAAQDGTLATIAANYDVRKGTGTLKVSGTASLNGNVSLTNQNAIFKLTLKDIDGASDVSANSVIISDQTGTVTTVTPASATNEMYVALPTTATTLKFLVTGSDSKKYFNMASSLSLGASYYQSTVKLATVGDVILSTGKCAKAGTGSPVAMIAYLGNESDCTNGLAIELSSSLESKKWDDNEAKNYAESLTAVPGGTWRLPSKADWQNMFVGCAKSGDAISPDGNGKMNPIAGFKEKIAATGITGLSILCWSSTGSGSYAWGVGVDLSDSNAYALFGNYNTSYSIYVLGCLAF